MIRQLSRPSVQRLTHAFPSPPPSLDAARRRLEQLRSRPVRILASDPDTLRLPTGLWIHTPAAEIIWADARTSKMHQLVIIGHELGHMICGHEPIPFDSAGTADTIARSAAAQVSHTPAPALAGLVGRCGGITDPAHTTGAHREREAEFVGRWLTRHFLDEHDHELARVLEGR